MYSKIKYILIFQLISRCDPLLFSRWVKVGPDSTPAVHYGRLSISTKLVGLLTAERKLLLYDHCGGNERSTGRAILSTYVQWCLYNNIKARRLSMNDSATPASHGRIPMAYTVLGIHAPKQISMNRRISPQREGPLLSSGRKRGLAKALWKLNWGPMGRGIPSGVRLKEGLYYQKRFVREWAMGA